MIPANVSRKKIDEGMKPVIEAAAAGDGRAQQQLQKHYRPYLRGVVKNRAVRGDLFPAIPGETKLGISYGVIEPLLDDIVDDTFVVLFFGSPLAESERQRRRSDDPDVVLGRIERGVAATTKIPPIQRWWGADPNHPPPAFATFLVGIAKNVAKQHITRAARGGRLVGGEIDELASAAGSAWEGEAAGTPNVPAERMRRAQRATPEQKQLGKEQLKLFREAMKQIRPEYAEVLELRTQGMSYSAIEDALDIPIGTVMNRLYRARKQVEELTGLPIRGLVGTAAAAFGVENRGRLAKGDVREPSEERELRALEAEVKALKAPPEPRKTTVVRRAARQNPGEVWIYFETFADVVDLHNEGLIDDDGFDQCVEALDAHGFV